MNRRLFVRMAKAALVVCFLALFVSSAAAQYSAVTLVSNTSVLTPIHMDANLVNGWGLVSSPTSPFWVADQNTSESTLYMSQQCPHSTRSEDFLYGRWSGYDSVSLSGERTILRTAGGQDESVWSDRHCVECLIH